MRCSLLCSLLIALALPVHAAEWRSTGDHELSFEASFEGATSPGRFRQFTVALDFDPAEPAPGRLRVTVDLLAADMGDPDMNAVLFDPAWLDVGQFEEAVYESNDLSQTSPGEYVATGTLKLKGISKTVEVPFSWTQTGDKASMRGQFVLRRTDFDVGSGEWATDEAIGLDIRLAFAVQLQRCE